MNAGVCVCGCVCVRVCVCVSVRERVEMRERETEAKWSNMTPSVAVLFNDEEVSSRLFQSSA